MFYCVLVRFVGKMTKNSKFWAMSRVLRNGEETPRNGEGSPHHSEAKGKVGPALGSPWRSHCSQHGNVVFLFRFVFPLFRRLVYWTNKDPISV